MDFKFEYGCNYRYINVSAIVEKLSQNGIIKLVGQSYNGLFTDPMVGRNKHLKVSNLINKNLKPVYIAEDASFTMRAKYAPFDLSTKINIVYFINIYCQKLYVYQLQSQLNELKKSGILDLPNAKFYAEVSGQISEHDEIKRKISSIIPNSTITCHVENLHEYFGINKVYELSSNYNDDDDDDDDGITLYFHSKGITHIKNPSLTRCRTQEELIIFNNVINKWQNTLWVFNQFDSINKLGICAGGIGWVWFNYWWARNSYLRKCERPIITTRRHYYEDWLSRFCNDDTDMIDTNIERNYDTYTVSKNDCYNILRNARLQIFNIGIGIEAFKALSLIYNSDYY